MPGVNPQLLSNSLNRARNLINDPEFNKLVENTARNKDTNSELFDSDYSMSNVNSSVPSKKVYNNKPIHINEMPESNFTNSKLPKEILDEMRRNPLDVNDATGSIIDNIIEPVKTKPSRPVANVRTNENVILQPSSNIDYTIIKAIIDESVRRNINDLIGNKLNESKDSDLKMLRISKGNKIQVVDSKGNLYEGVLTLKKNLIKK